MVLTFVNDFNSNLTSDIILLWDVTVDLRILN